MKHKHSEMIKAWLDNTDLVVLVKTSTSWILANSPTWSEGYEYFLCHPKHKKAVLELLNGGEVEVRRGVDFITLKAKWVGVVLSESYWEADDWYMQSIAESRIKPKKQTRYAYATPDGGITVHYGTKDELERYCIGMLGKNGFELITFEI